MSLLPFLLFCGCTDSNSDKPIIEIVGIYIDGDENNTNYAKGYNRLPVLEKGDKVDILIKLHGNGDDLRSFIVQSDEEIKTLIIFQIDEVSEELSEADKGILVYNDNIRETGLTVKAEILKSEETEHTISFFLSSKAVGSEGEQLDLILKTQ